MYTVRGPDGNVYGPVSIDVLRQWVREGRVLPTTMVTEVETGFEVAASSLPGLFTMGPTDWSQPPSPYPRTQPGSGPVPGYSPQTQQELSMGWTYFGIGVFGCFCCAVLSWIFYPLAIVNANRVIAAGDQRGQTLKILSIVFLVLALLAAVANLFVWMSMMESGRW